LTHQTPQTLTLSIGQSRTTNQMAPATLRSHGLLDETSGTSPPSPQENTINERLLKHMERMEAKMDTIENEMNNRMD